VIEMRTLVLLSLAALLVPAAAGAEDRPLTLGLRVGYAPALGDAEKGAEMSNAVRSQIPLQLDAAYRITRDVAVGAYFAYGFGRTGDLDGLCTTDTIDCSTRILRFGVQGFYTFHEAQTPLVPWAGAGLGYELGSLELKGSAGKATFDYGGFELLNVQVGGDYRVNDRFAFGPYFQFSVARYSRMKVENTVDPAARFDGSIPEKALHEWLGFGVRGKLDL
jgi:outer membrane protein W